MKDRATDRDTQNRIWGRVARVIDDRSLVINRGRQDGVQEGMTFAVLNPNGLDVRDPDAPDQILGSIELPKVYVRVTDVQEKLCLAQTYRTHATHGPWDYPQLFLSGLRVTETLRQPSPHQPGEPEDYAIEVVEGDPVVQAPEANPAPSPPSLEGLHDPSDARA